MEQMRPPYERHQLQTFKFVLQSENCCLPRPKREQQTH
jgi:hypothetical protein